MHKKYTITLLISDYLNLIGYSMFFPFYALFASGFGASPQIIGYTIAFNTVITGLVVLIYGFFRQK